MQRDDRIAGRDSSRSRGTVGIHVADADAILLGGPHGQDAEEAVLERFEFRRQFELALDPLLAAQHGHAHLLAGVAAADFLLDVGRADDLAAVDLDDPIAGLQAGRGGGAFARQAAMIGSPV